MDPATIIGTTSAILSFVLFSGKIISTAVQIHKSANGASDDNEKLADVIAKFGYRHEKLRQIASPYKAKAPNATGGDELVLEDAERQLLEAMLKCEDLAKKIEGRLKETSAASKPVRTKPVPSWTGRASRKLFRRPEAANTQSGASENMGATLSETIRAAVQTVWQKEAVEELRKDWEICSIQLDQAIVRFETKSHREMMCGFLEHQSTDLACIRDLVCTLVEASQKIANLESFLQDVQQVDSISSRERRNHEKILDALNFNGMHARRDQVAEPAKNTLAWLVENELIPGKLSPGLRISLREWLRVGTDVFHITGKPGSGKSTLMRLIDKSVQADLQLQQWAVNDHKELIRASCYLWKAAESNPLQKELDGLTRTLLFQILQRKPHLTRTLFENHPCWKPNDFTLANCIQINSHSTHIELGPQEILAAFEAALAIPGHCFFFLIDGLDEMRNDRGHEHEAVAERILDWSTRNPGNIKICVASREDRVFMSIFPPSQRLQLHAVTSEDIRALVDLKLQKHEYLTCKERGDLAFRIAIEAKGVFLWVVLALEHLVPLLRAKQGIYWLKREVETLPGEMSVFLAETLTRIPACYRKEAWAVFTVLALMNGRHFNQSYSLIHYSMLEKSLDGRAWKLGEHNDWTRVQDRAHHLQDFVSRFSEFSMGLLDLPGISSDQTLSELDPWATKPRFSHRSVYDFLQEHPDKLSEALAVPHQLYQLSPAELIVRSTIQVINSFSLEELPKEKHERLGANSVWGPLVFTTLTDGNPVFALLNILEDAILRKQGAILGQQQFNETRWTDLRLSPHTHCIFHFAFTHPMDYYKPFVEWAQKKGNYPTWITSKEFKAWIVQKVFHDRYFDDITSPTAMECADDVSEEIELLCKRGGLSFNDLMETSQSLIPVFSPIFRGPLWLHLFMAVFVCEGHGTLGMAEYCTRMLKHGVNLDIQFEWWSDCHFSRQSNPALCISSGDEDILNEDGREKLQVLEDKSDDDTENVPGDGLERRPWSRRTKVSGTESEVCGIESESDLPSKSNKTPQNESQGDSDPDALREWLRKWKSRGAFPPGSSFGMTLKIRGNEEPQLIQGPQWTDIMDNELLPVFVAVFKKAAGVATLEDLLKNWVSEMLMSQYSKDLFEKWASEVNEGRIDLETAGHGMFKEAQKCSDWSDRATTTANKFAPLYQIVRYLGAQSRPVPRNDTLEGPGEKSDGNIGNPKSQDGRRVLTDSEVDSLKDKSPPENKVRHGWSTMAHLCIGLLVAIFVSHVLNKP